LGPDRADPLGQLRQDVLAAAVEDGVDGVEAQPVDAVVADPLLGVLDRPLAHGGLRVVERLAPEPVVAVGEVRPVRGDELRADLAGLIARTRSASSVRTCLRLRSKTAWTASRRSPSMR